jgi:hypothetical protein
VEDLEKKGQRFEGSLKLKSSLNCVRISIPSLRKYQVWTLTGRSGMHPFWRLSAQYPSNRATGKGEPIANQK